MQIPCIDNSSLLQHQWIFMFRWMTQVLLLVLCGCGKLEIQSSKLYLCHCCWVIAGQGGYIMENPRQYLFCSKCQWDHCRWAGCWHRVCQPGADLTLLMCLSLGLALGPHDCSRQHEAHHSAPHRAAALPDSSEPCLLLLGQPNTNCWADLSLNSGANCSWCWLLNATRHTEKSDALKALSCTVYPLALFSLLSSFTAHNTLGWFLTN